MSDGKLKDWYIKHHMLYDEEEQIYIDDDQYWINGYYDNPTDKRTMVDKRFGIGTSYNMAQKTGKVFTIVAVSVLTLVLGGIFILLATMDFTTFHLTIHKDTVTVDAPLYGYEFQIEDIEQIILTDTMPTKGMRTNGAATELYMLGNFNLTGYGKAKVYVYTDSPLYIMIKLKTLTVFFNTRTETETREYYEMLMQKLEY